MPSMVVKQIPVWPVPQNVLNRPTDLTPGATVRLAIEFDGHGYCLLATEIDGDYSLSEWHPSLKAAEQRAGEIFGPRSRDWETVELP